MARYGTRRRRLTPSKQRLLPPRLPASTALASLASRKAGVLPPLSPCPPAAAPEVFFVFFCFTNFLFQVQAVSFWDFPAGWRGAALTGEVGVLETLLPFFCWSLCCFFFFVITVLFQVHFTIVLCLEGVAQGGRDALESQVRPPASPPRPSPIAPTGGWSRRSTWVVFESTNFPANNLKASKDFTQEYISSEETLVLSGGCRGKVEGLEGLVRETSGRLEEAIRPRKMCHHARPFVGVFQSQFLPGLSTFGNNSQQNGSKNGETAPRPGTGYPHKGPSVD